MRLALVLLMGSIAQAHAESYSGAELYELCAADLKSVQAYVAGVNDMP